MRDVRGKQSSVGRILERDIYDFHLNDFHLNLDNYFKGAVTMCESNTKQPSEVLILERDIIELHLNPAIDTALGQCKLKKVAALEDARQIVRDAFLRVSPEYRKWRYLFEWPVCIASGQMTDARLLAWLRLDAKPYICVQCGLVSSKIPTEDYGCPECGDPLSFTIPDMPQEK